MIGKIPLSRALALMRSASLEEREICGFICHDWQVRFVENVAEEPTDTFEMKHDEVRHLYNTVYGELAGMLHSHPGGTERPSQADINNAPDSLRYFIVTATSVTEWKFIDGDQRSAYMVDKVRYDAKADRPTAYRLVGDCQPAGRTADPSTGRQG